MRVFWPYDRCWYVANVLQFNAISGEHEVEYDDDDREWLDIERHSAGALMALRVQAIEQRSALEEHSKKPSINEKDDNQPHVGEFEPLLPALKAILDLNIINSFEQLDLQAAGGVALPSTVAAAAAAVAASAATTTHAHADYTVNNGETVPSQEAPGVFDESGGVGCADVTAPPQRQLANDLSVIEDTRSFLDDIFTNEHTREEDEEEDGEEGTYAEEVEVDNVGIRDDKNGSSALVSHFMVADEAFLEQPEGSNGASEREKLRGNRQKRDYTEAKSNQSRHHPTTKSRETAQLPSKALQSSSSSTTFSLLSSANHVNMDEEQGMSNRGRIRPVRNIARPSRYDEGFYGEEGDEDEESDGSLEYHEYDTMYENTPDQASGIHFAKGSYEADVSSAGVNRSPEIRVTAQRRSRKNATKKSRGKALALRAMSKMGASTSNNGVSKAVRRMVWSASEDLQLSTLVDQYGAKQWSLIAQHMPGRIGKQCRERWHNHLNPEVTKESWTAQEDAQILSLHQQ